MEIPMARLLVVIALFGLTSFSHGQVPDHLECYKVKDPAAKAKYTADLGGLAPEMGCVIKVPGVLLCVGSAKTSVVPTPPNASDSGQPVGRFLCYKVKCPKGAVAEVPWLDQFGSRTLVPSGAKLLCAPEIVTTTTTTSTTTTTLCQPNPDACGFRECGTVPDGCGGTVFCGTCTPPFFCSVTGVCICTATCP
jgi:hypothetical protein